MDQTTEQDHIRVQSRVKIGGNGSVHFFHVADSREHLWYLRHRVDHLVTEMNQAKAKTFVDLSV